MAAPPTALELKVLRRVWELGGAATVREVLAGWGPKPRPAYTTVLKVFQIMESKGLVSHEQAGRSYRYRARLKRDTFSRDRLREIVSGLFSADRLQLVNALVQEMRLSPAELRELRRMLSAREGKP